MNEVQTPGPQYDVDDDAVEDAALAVRAENVGPFLECQIGGWLAGHDVASITSQPVPSEAFG
jgi:hypothetical protein